MRLAAATHAPVRISPAQIDAARCAIVSVAERLGVPWDARRSRPASGDYWALCPFHAEKTASFHVVDRGVQSWFKCHGCGEKGDAIKLHRALTGVGFREAVQGIVGDLEAAPDPSLIEARERRRREMEAETKRRLAANRAAAVAIWETAEPIGGTAAMSYLRVARRAHGHLGCADLRFHPAAPLSPYEPHKAGMRPALVGEISDAHDGHIGTHLTYLRPDGLGKAELAHLPGSRLICGQHAGAFIRLGPVRDAVVIGEGVETTLSASDACGLPGIAAINSANLRALVLPASVKRVVIAPDRDAKGAGQLSAEVLAERLWADGLTVELMPPPAGFKDWNDAAQAGALAKRSAAA